MSKMKIEMKSKFYDMLAKGVIKKSWTTIESYGLDTFVGAMFEESLDYEELGGATYKTHGVVGTSYYEGFFYGDVHINHAFIHENNDIILIGEGDSMIIIENEPTCIFIFEK